MSPKLAIQGIATFQPTEEELNAARLILTKVDAGGKKAQMQSMTNWLKKNLAQPGNEEALASMGARPPDVPGTLYGHAGGEVET